MKTNQWRGTMAACFLAVGSTMSLGQSLSHNWLMPVPAKLQLSAGELALGSPFAVEFSGVQDERLARAVDRALYRMEMKTGLPHMRNVAEGSVRLAIKVMRPGDAVQSIDEDESYTLTVTAKGVELNAATDVGAMHGLETLIQLVQPGGNGYVLPYVSIDDAPRFRWRGLMMDCGRHFEPVSEIERTLDGMAAVKLNVFHWHLTEDQGFRIESKAFPKLTADGSDGLFYTQEQARAVVAYAQDRGIRVVPEFEMPGHSAAWLVAYPELASGTTPTGIRREFGVSLYAMDPTREETYLFLARFFEEMAGIFPDAYVHVGGDETPAPDWKSNPRIVGFMRQHDLKDNAALQAYFNSRVLQLLQRLHKHMMGWDEVLTPGLPKDVVVQSWRGGASLVSGAKQGYQGVLSAPYYLDRMDSAGTYYLADPLSSSLDLTPAQSGLVLGGEVCMWSEHVYSRTIDSRIWPRTAAIAERFWSPEDVRDVDAMYRRLASTSIELEGLGLTHLQSGDAGLRELAGSEDIAAIHTIASVLEPVSFHDRSRTQHTDQLTALDQLVDAVRPDPPSRHGMESLVKLLFSNPSSARDVAGQLDSWFVQLAKATAEERVKVSSSPRLAVAGTRIDQLSGLAETGHEAVRYLASGEKAPVGWKAAQMKKIEEAGKPDALVRFTFLGPLSDLVKAVQEQ